MTNDTCLFIVALISLDACFLNAQIIVPPCPLDSADFTSKTQRKMWGYDTLFTTDITHKINYLAALHRNFLPSHKSLKDSVKNRLDTENLAALKRIDSFYYDRLGILRAAYLGENPGFNENLPVFAHLDYVVVFEIFRFYPDLYAILFNPVQGVSKKRTPYDERKSLLAAIEGLYAGTQQTLFREHGAAYRAFLDKLSKLQKKHFYYPMWQGSIEEAEREKYNRINFLIWCSRKY